MASFPSFSGLLKSANKGALKDFLTGAGLTLATSGTSLIAFNLMVVQFRSSTESIPLSILGLAHVAGFDLFFSIILGAYVTKFTLGAGNLNVIQKIK